MSEEGQVPSGTELPSAPVPARLDERSEDATRPRTPLGQGPHQPPGLPSTTAHTPLSHSPLSPTPRRAYTRRLVSDPIPQAFIQNPRSLSTPSTPLPPSPLFGSGVFYSPQQGFVRYVCPQSRNFVGGRQC